MTTVYDGRLLQAAVDSGAREVRIPPGGYWASAQVAETWTPGMFERPCGGCTVCCKVAGVPEIDEPANTWCPNCDKGKGCKIYEHRPRACRDFYCLWKVMPDFPEELRPDKCKVLWQLTEDGEVAVATTEYAEALQGRRQARLVRNFRALGISVVVRSRQGRVARAWLAPGKGWDDVSGSLASSTA